MSETTSAPSLPRRTLRSLGTAGLWLARQTLTPAVLIPLLALLATWAGFQQNAALYRRAALAAQWYDATLIAALLAPALIGHLTAWVSGHRSGFWWLLWLPAVALYWLRPWHTGTEWAFFWREHLKAWTHVMDIIRLQEQAPLRSFIRLGGLLTMVMVTFMVLARSWLRLTAWLKDIGRDAGGGAAFGGGGKAGAGKAEGLPQATWASASEVRRQFSHKGGIVLGEHTDPLERTPGFDPNHPRGWNGQGKGRLITMDPARGNGHVIVLAASAGYKTAGIVIPNILHYTGPLVVIDPKGDLYARTREARKAMRFDARVIDARRGFDPFKLIAPLAPEAPSVYLTMARTLMPLGERSSDLSEYFHEMSTTLFAALMGHFISENSDNVARDISTFINREREDVIEDAQYIATQHNFPFISDELEGLAALDERTFPGVVKGISNKLAFARFPDIAAYGQSTESPATHLEALGPKSDIFINFPAQAAEDFSSFPRLLIGAIYVACELIEQPDRPRARRLFLIDEARVLGGTSALNTIRDAGRSLGLHLMLIYQNYGQLTKAWGGDAGAAAWLDSCEARVISAVGSSRTASDIITMLGRRTLRTRVQGSSSSSPVMTPMGGSVSSSEQEQIREVSLMSAATLGQLPAHGALIFTRRTRPILATKAVYFTRENMAKRVKSPDAVKDELEATRRREAVMKRIKEQEPADTPEQKLKDLPDPQPGLRRRRRTEDPEAAGAEDAEAEAADAGDATQRTGTTGQDMEPEGNAPTGPAGAPAGPPGGDPDPEPMVEDASDAPPVTDSGASDADMVNAPETGEAREDAADPNPEWDSVESVIRNMDEAADGKPGDGDADVEADDGDAPEQDGGQASDAQTAAASETGRLDMSDATETAPLAQDSPNPPEAARPNAPETGGPDAPVPDFRARSKQRIADALAGKARRKQAENAAGMEEAGPSESDTSRDAGTGPSPEPAMETRGPKPEEQQDVKATPPSEPERGPDDAADDGPYGAALDPEAGLDEGGVEALIRVMDETARETLGVEPGDGDASDDPGDRDAPGEPGDGDAPGTDSRPAPGSIAGHDLTDEDQFALESIMAHLEGRPALRTAIADGLRDEPEQGAEAGQAPEDSTGRGPDEAVAEDAPRAGQSAHDAETGSNIETGPAEDAGAAEKEATGTVEAEEDRTPQTGAAAATAERTSTTGTGSAAAKDAPDRVTPEPATSATDIEPAEDGAESGQVRAGAEPDAEPASAPAATDVSRADIDAARALLAEDIGISTAMDGGADAETGQRATTEEPATAGEPVAEEAGDRTDAPARADANATPDRAPTTPSEPDAPDGPAPVAPAKKPRKQKTAPRDTSVARRRRALKSAEVRDAFDPHIEEFFRDRFGEPARPGSAEWRPKDRDGFSLRVRGEKRGQWKDHSAGTGGGLFDLIAIELCNLPNATADFPRVLEAAAGYVGFSPTGETAQTRKARQTRKENRARAARAEEQRKAEENAVLALALRGLAWPLAGSPAEAYLAHRRITEYPTTGLAFLPSLDILPESLRKQVFFPDHPALVAWAANEAGAVTGGQRILLDADGQPVSVSPGKPAFGNLKSAPARFPARDAAAKGPLLVAEGPESALTLWLAAGFESWAVFGVSNWQSAPLPLERDIILAPDRDAPDSPANAAFRKAVAHHLGRGCRLRIAPAPEPEGSRKDLNDTLMERGLTAVQAALAAAHEPGPDDLPVEGAPQTAPASGQTEEGDADDDG